jgi:hypothetical protein
VGEVDAGHVQWLRTEVGGGADWWGPPGTERGERGAGCGAGLAGWAGLGHWLGLTQLGWSTSFFVIFCFSVFCSEFLF